MDRESRRPMGMRDLMHFGAAPRSLVSALFWLVREVASTRMDPPEIRSWYEGV